MNFDKLREEARQRWGERWTLETREWADGSRRARAIHSRGRTEDGDRLKRDELTITEEGEVVVERVELYRDRKVIDTKVEKN